MDALSKLLTFLVEKGHSDAEVIAKANIDQKRFEKWKRDNINLYNKHKALSEALSIFGFEDKPLAEINDPGVMDADLEAGIPKEKVELVDHICQGIKRGLSIAQACLYAGTTSEEITPFLRACEAARRAVNRAHAENIAWWLDAVKEKARAGVWQAATWYLERAHPHYFGQTRSLVDRKDKPQVDAAGSDVAATTTTGDYVARVGADGTILSGDISDEKFKQMLAALE